jgi:adenylate cyclase
LQRVRYDAFDQIEGALAKLKTAKASPASLDAVTSQTFTTVDDGKLRLAVLPFDDLSPSRENEWFADGMMEELIGTLGSLDQLRVNPRNDVIYYKRRQPTLTEVAADLGVRYVVAGSVQKAGEKIRIRVSLSDTRSHEQLWSHKYDGTFDDVFEFQESVSLAIAEALKLQLTPNEILRIGANETNNPEAYELYLKAEIYYRRHNKADYECAIGLYEEAIRLDPKFALAVAQLGNTYSEIYRVYTRTPQMLERAEKEAVHLYELEGESERWCRLKASLAIRRCDYEAAVVYAKRAIEISPTFSAGHDVLGSAYHAMGKLKEAAIARENYVRLQGNVTNTHFSLVTVLNELGDKEELCKAAERAIPIYQRHIRFNPDDYTARIQYANILAYSGHKEEASEVGEELIAVPTLDGFVHYNLACLFLMIGKKDLGMQSLEKSVALGGSNIEYFRRDPDLDPLRDTPEFKALLDVLEKKIEVEKHG